MKNLFKKDIVLSYVLLSYFIIGLLLIPHVQHQINTDGISYITIAKKYLTLDTKNAINGYWSPLFSWILALFLSLGLKPLLTAKILILLIGSAVITSTRRLSMVFKIDRNISNIIIIGLIPITISFAFSIITPDLLTIPILFYYFSIIFDEKKYLNNPKNGWYCGMLGALGYFCKSYLFYFFLAHFIIINIIYFFQTRGNEQAKILLKMFFQALLVFTIISGAWITLLSFKYHKFTVGTAGNYNQILIGPIYKKVHPTELNRILTPPNNSAVNAWEDPSSLNSDGKWSPFESWQYFKYYILIIIDNIKQLFLFLNIFSPLSILILIGLCLNIKNNPISQKILITILIYCAGYVLIVLEKRYLWVICILLILSTGHILSCVFKKHNTPLKSLAMSAIIISFMSVPIYHLITYKNKGEHFFIISQKIKNDYHIKGTFADNHKEKFLPITQYLTFHLESRYLGVILKEKSEVDFENIIKKNKIDYYFSYGEDEFPFLKKYKEETNGEISGLKIYNLSSINNL